MKNLAELKRVKEGTPVTVKNYMKHTGTQERIVVKVQTNGIYTGVEVSQQEKEDLIATKRYWEENFVTLDGKIYKKIWLPFQKASQMKFEDNVVKFLAYEVQPERSYQELYIAPSSEFEAGETWLELVF